jgi:hypothetical protein
MWRLDNFFAWRSLMFSNTIHPVHHQNLAEERPVRGIHDMGGLPAGPIDRSEHQYAPWEKRVHVLLILLSDPSRNLVSTDELRCGIESLGAQEYDRLNYYERWIASITNTLLRKGVFTVEELGRTLAEIEAREGKAT